MSNDDYFIEQLRDAARDTPHVGVDAAGVLRTGRRRRRTRITSTAAAACAVGVGAVLVVPSLLPAPQHAPPATAPPAATPTAAPTPSPSPTGAPGPCAEFPPWEGDGRDYEGWWSSSPSDADGNILTDPADWPPVMREHLRTAVVLTDTGEVLSTWDRLTCGPIPDYVPPPDDEWPTGSVVVLDATTGEVVASSLDTSAPPKSVTEMVAAASDGLSPDAVPQGYHLIDDHLLAGTAEHIRVYATDDYEAHQADLQHPRGPVVATRLVAIPEGAHETQPPPPEGIDVYERPDIAEGAVLYVEPGGAGPLLTIPAGEFDIIIAGTDASPEVVLQFANAIAR